MGCFPQIYPVLPDEVAARASPDWYKHLGRPPARILDTLYDFLVTAARPGVNLMTLRQSTADVEQRKQWPQFRMPMYRRPNTSSTSSRDKHDGSSQNAIK